MVCVSAKLIYAFFSLFIISVFVFDADTRTVKVDLYRSLHLSQNAIYDELLRLEIRALKRLPWNVGALDGGLGGLQSSAAVTDGIQKVQSRTDEGGDGNGDAGDGNDGNGDGPSGVKRPDRDQGDMTLQLWENTQDFFKVPVNNKFKAFPLIPTESIVITTGTCNGCTVVALCDGKLCIMAHYKQSNDLEDSWAQGDDENQDFSKFILGPFADGLLQYRDQLSTTPFAVVFTPAGGTGAFKYPWRIDGQGSISEEIMATFPLATLLKIGYNYYGARADIPDWLGWGKIVLEWRGGGSTCGVGDVSTLNLFAEENWWESLHFDEDGNPVSLDRSPCYPPTGSYNGFDV